MRVSQERADEWRLPRLPGTDCHPPPPAHLPSLSQADAPNESKLLALPGKGAFEQRAEWRERERKLVWSLKNLKGGREHTLRCRLTGAS